MARPTFGEFEARLESVNYAEQIMLLKIEHGANDERVSVVRERLRKHKEEAVEYVEANVAAEFARESAHISGKGKKHTSQTYIDSFEKHEYKGLTYEIHTGVLGYADQLFKQHIELADRCICEDEAPPRLLQPSSINDALRGSRGEIWWRDGRKHGMWQCLPRPEYVERLVTMWIEFESHTVASYREKSEVARDAISWALYDLLVAIEPYSGATDRTARLILQLHRRRLGLEPVLIREMNMPYHEKRFSYFRDNVFVPLMQRFIT